MGREGVGSSARGSRPCACPASMERADMQRRRRGRTVMWRGAEREAPGIAARALPPRGRRAEEGGGGPMGTRECVRRTGRRARPRLRSETVGAAHDRSDEKVVHFRIHPTASGGAACRLPGRGVPPVAPRTDLELPALAEVLPGRRGRSGRGGADRARPPRARGVSGGAPRRARRPGVRGGERT